jgi:alanine racemase
MSLTLYITTPAWRGHLEEAREHHAGLVPVIKGNGYGFGNTRLAAEAKGLAIAAVAVGLLAEVPEVSPVFGGDILVMAPWGADAGRVDDSEDDASLGDRLIRTVSDLSALAALADRVGRGDRPRVVVEVLTPMLRHGIPPEDLPAVARLLPSVRCEGVALHLPMTGNRYAVAAALLGRVRETLPTVDTAWVSHLDPAGVSRLASETGIRIRSRLGTALWLGDRRALSTRATVLDVHRLHRGTRYGYRQRRAKADGHLIIVSGGTAHGVGLEAPKAAFGLVNRGKIAGIGGLAATGHTLSPFHIGGRQRWFAEPPHMQVSMVLLPARVPPPRPGDEIDVDVRMTITTFDRIVDLPAQPAQRPTE